MRNSITHYSTFDVGLVSWEAMEEQYTWATRARTFGRADNQGAGVRERQKGGDDW